MIPFTYYDVLVKRDPKMLEFVLKDIKALDGEPHSPFGSVDDYSQYFENYRSEIMELITDDLRTQLYSIGVTEPSQLQLRIKEFHASPIFKQLLFSKQLDYLTLTNFELFGKKTFHISNNLVEHLAQTSLEADSELLELPFKSCLFMYKSKEVIRAFHALDNRNNKVIDLETPVSVFAHSMSTDIGKRKLLFACYHANYKTSYSFIKRELLIRKNWNITQALKTDWGYIYSEKQEEAKEVEINTFNLNQSKNDKLFYEEGLLFFRILINTILYISSNQPDIISRLSPYATTQEKLKLLKSKSEIKKLKRKIDYTSKLDYESVGEHLPMITIDKQRDSNSSKKVKEQLSTQDAKRFMVRGHWRNQPCGTNSKKRKLIWIKPYYKGSEIADLINKSYIVK